MILVNVRIFLISIKISVIRLQLALLERPFESVMSLMTLFVVLTKVNPIFTDILLKLYWAIGILMWLEDLAGQELPLLPKPYKLLLSVYLPIRIYDDGWNWFSLLVILALLLGTLLSLVRLAVRNNHLVRLVVVIRLPKPYLRVVMMPRL